MTTLLLALALSAANPALMDPAKATATAPKTFKVKFTTTKGDFVVDVHRDWAPHGADRFFNLVKAGFFTDVAFFRAIAGFMVQFGISGDPAVSAKWADANLQDDPVKEHNTPGALTFAMAGPNTRTTQMFINFADNSRLDGMGFAPFARVSKGMDVVNKINTEYGEGAPGGRGPSQDEAQSKGNPYFKASFPNLDYIKTATIVAGKAK